MFESIPAGAWAVIGTVFGTIALKLGEKYLARAANQRDDRKSYRDEISELRERLDKVEEEVTFWRERYYSEQTVSATFRRMLIDNGIPLPP